MSTLLIDTSALHALHYARDRNHAAAVDYFRLLVGRARPILTEWVFVETMNLTKARLGPQYAISYGRQLKASQAFYPLPLLDADKQLTWVIFEQHQDKQWSYVDCSLLAVARRLEIQRVFAFDRHFAQMGLDVVP
jgi:predicted nucleic acid-binding protein